MIKTGILGGETLAAGELIRILINHPDVDLRVVASNEKMGHKVADVHRGLTGDVDLTMESEVNPAMLNVVFLCGEPWQAVNWMDKYSEIITTNEVKIIDLTGALRNGEHNMVYGFAEHNRKALVRGATMASVPSAIAMALNEALYPLAKNMLLSGNIEASVSIASTELFDGKGFDETKQADQTILSTRLDPVAPIEHRIDGRAAATETLQLLKDIQPTFNGDIKLKVSRDNNVTRGIKATVDIYCPAGAPEIERLFAEAYSDHSFSYIVEQEPEILDVANTNKCLVHVGYPPLTVLSANGVGQRLRITTVVDNLLKGAAGNAVHCMNLLFGLSERTGLALKASAF